MVSKPSSSSELYGHIQVRGARENNLKNISVDIPKRQITVFTGVSGSGKSSLVFGTIAAESQRLLNETFSAFVQNFLPRIGQPDADSLENMSAAIIVDQKRLGGNSRSTVGTITDTYTLLRILYSRIGTPTLGTARAFSFNDPIGMCQECEGIGQASVIDVDALIDWDKSINQGAIRFPTFAPGSWFHDILIQSGYFDLDKPIRAYSEEERQKFLYFPEAKIKVSFGGKAMNLTYEGVLPKFKRVYLQKDMDQHQPNIRAALEKIVTVAPCALCGGARLTQEALAVRIGGTSIAACVDMEVRELATFLRALDAPSGESAITALLAKLDNLITIGLGYLNLSRETTTLSGGESQRVKMVRYLGSSLTDVTYVFDEPSIGLHPHDIHRLNEILVQLRDKGNTVLVVEHKPKVINIADHIVDMGPGAGRNGGHIVYHGDLPGLLASGTLTGNHMRSHQPIKTAPRPASGDPLTIAHATLHNLQDVSVEIPRGVLTVVTGVAGSGKSALIRGTLPHLYPVTAIDQSLARGSSRSNLATYSGMADTIRKRFATANKVAPALFSANSKGACPECKGIGLIYTDLAFLDPVASICETCGGKQFTDEVLGYTIDGKSIADVLSMSVVEAGEFFAKEKSLRATLTALVDVGLGYLTLRQPLTTLSGGERQRLKLATELGSTAQIYILDEPTTGLHMHDVETLIGLLDRLVDQGSTVIVIEHNLDVIARADWIIDLGPGAGRDGGRIVFQGTPAALMDDTISTTGHYLREHAAALQSV
jgi:excinuclease UvrABC ATPase subunit